MATIKNIKLPENKWVNLYTIQAVVDAGITTADKLLIQNTGSTNIQLNSDVIPTIDSGFKRLPPDKEATNTVDDTTAWVRSTPVDGLVNVSKAV